MKLILIVALATTIIVQTVVTTDTNDTESIRTARSIANLFSIIPVNSDERNSEGADDDNPFGLIGRVFNAEVINSVVSKIFNVVELKLSIFTAVRRFLSYENVRNTLLLLRRVSNYLLRLCTFVNRYLPEAAVDTTGLQALLEVHNGQQEEAFLYPEKIQSSYNTPKAPESTYGAPTTISYEFSTTSSSVTSTTTTTTTPKPTEKVTEVYGLPFPEDIHQAFNYHQNYPVREPFQEYGAPKPFNEYGVPQQYNFPSRTADVVEVDDYEKQQGKILYDTPFKESPIFLVE